MSKTRVSQTFTSLCPLEIAVATRISRSWWCRGNSVSAKPQFLTPARCRSRLSNLHVSEFGCISHASVRAGGHSSPYD